MLAKLIELLKCLFGGCGDGGSDGNGAGTGSDGNGAGTGSGNGAGSGSSSFGLPADLRGSLARAKAALGPRASTAELTEYMLARDTAVRMHARAILNGNPALLKSFLSNSAVVAAKTDPHLELARLVPSDRSSHDNAYYLVVNAAAAAVARRMINARRRLARGMPEHSIERAGELQAARALAEMFRQENDQFGAAVRRAAPRDRAALVAAGAEAMEKAWRREDPMVYDRVKQRITRAELPRVNVGSGSGSGSGSGKRAADDSGSGSRHLPPALKHRLRGPPRVVDAVPELPPPPAARYPFDGVAFGSEQFDDSANNPNEKSNTEPADSDANSSGSGKDGGGITGEAAELARRGLAALNQRAAPGVRWDTVPCQTCRFAAARMMRRAWLLASWCPAQPQPQVCAAVAREVAAAFDRFREGRTLWQAQAAFAGHPEAVCANMCPFSAPPADVQK
jgi:hypothetical protein